MKQDQEFFFKRRHQFRKGIPDLVQAKPADVPANGAGGKRGARCLPNRFGQVFACGGVAGDRASGKLLDDLSLLVWPCRLSTKAWSTSLSWSL